jgi:hypothetical protein
MRHQDAASLGTASSEYWPRYVLATLRCGAATGTCALASCHNPAATYIETGTGTAKLTS